MLPAMSEPPIGMALRTLRLRLNKRQEDIAAQASVPRAVVGLIEHGNIDQVTVGQLRRVAAALDARIWVAARWRGGDLDRLVNSRHSAMHETMARFLAGQPGWQAEPAVSL